MNECRLKKIFIFSIMLFIFINVKLIYVKAFQKELNFNKIDINNGLSQGAIKSILQDKDGYMWIATGDGLNKYNGKNFKIYKHDKENTNSLSDSYTFKILQDFDNNIWVGTANGVNKFNPYTEESKRYNMENYGLTSLNNYIVDMIKDEDSNLWIGTENGLIKYDKDNDSFEKINIPEMGENTQSSFILSLYQDDSDIWIGTKKGLFVYNKNSQDRKAYYDGNGIDSDYIYKIEEDRHENIWIGTRNGGLNIYNKNTKKFKSYKNNNEETSIPSNSIRAIYQDNVGTMWIGTTEGLCCYDEEKDTFKTYVSNINCEKSIVDNNVSTIFQDKSGIMWVGTLNGISTFNPSPLFNHYRKAGSNVGISDNLVTGIYKDKEGFVWAGTISDGLNLIDRKTGEVKTFKHDENDINSLSDNNILEITGDDEDNIWIATKVGLNKYNKKEKKFYRFQQSDYENSIISNEVRALFYDKKDNALWIGTGKGIDKLDLKTEKFTNYNDTIFSVKDDEKNIVTIYGDSNNNIWFGASYYGGLTKFNKDDKSVKNFKSLDEDKSTISTNGIRNITEDKEGNIWIATIYGLNKLNPKTEVFERYTEKEGLSNNYVYGILIDEENNPWVSTNYGICKFDRLDNTFYIYSEADGLQGNEFNAYAYNKGYDGEFFFGGSKGLSSFYPKDINEKLPDDKVMIDEFKVYDRKISIKDKINVNYDSNYFSIDFFIPNYKNIKRVKYAYMLEGVDKDWVYTNDRQYVTYRNINGGKYTFKVKAKNNRGIWTEETQLNINVASPPWKSLFAYNMYIIVGLIIAFIVWNRVKILENLVKQRTKELNNKLAENKVLYSKLLSQEKGKNDYFVNLSHELRTPLNVILTTVQLINSFNKDANGISKENVTKYMKIIDKNSNSLLSIITDIIDTSKMESGNYRINRKYQDIVYIVEEIALSMKSYIESNGINLIVDPEIEEKIIFVDSVEIERCVVNLISNAVKFTKEGGTITVNIYEKEEFIEIHIRDTGSGISEEDQKLIFERFKQADNQKNSRKGGSGIGLALVKSIAELHGGSISVKSKLNEGSDFIIKLPNCKEEDIKEETDA